MFQVKGYIDGVSYAVRYGDESGETPPRMERAGKVLGSGRAIDVLRQNVGVPVLVTPTGPTVIGSLATPAGVLAVLTARTEVTAVTGDDVPELVPAGEPGVVY